MIDIFGSKPTYQVIKNFFGEEAINIAVISSTLESQFSKSESLSRSKLESLNEEEIKIVEDDFRKSFRLNKNRGNVLVVDFLNERNNIIQFNNSKITSNSEVRKYIGKTSTKNVTLESRVNSIQTLLDRFLELTSSYEKVIVLELYLTNYSLDENNLLDLNPNQYSINKVNALLKTFYEHIKFLESDFVFLPFTDLYSFKDHKGRLTPWLYSDFTIKTIGEAVSQHINEK